MKRCGDCKKFGDGESIIPSFLCGTMHCSSGKIYGCNNPVVYGSTKASSLCDSPDEFEKRDEE